MSRFSNLWPLDRIKTQHAAFLFVEAVVICAAWWLYAWQTEKFAICLAVTVFAAYSLLNFNGWIIGWLNRPRKKKEPTKEEQRKNNVNRLRGLHR